jgi:Heterokaryon incompatibility protein (HET)
MAIYLLNALSENDAQPTTISRTNTGSPQTTAFIKQQLATCDKNHTVCHSVRTNTNWYPTRLLDLQPSNPTPGADSIRLVISAEDALKEPYATLSHCWGSSTMLELRQINLTSFRQDMFLYDLPTTFQHAIIVARSLSIRYLWIDSLCIIQDSASDWAAEAMQMHAVYRHAYLNIAATNSPNSSVGLFFHCDPSTLGETPVTLSAGPLSGLYRLVDQDYYTHLVDNAPLNRRAWVVQERLLSTRTVHFAAEQVLWDCYSLTSSETFPAGVETWSPAHSGFINAKRGSLTLREAGSGSEDAAIQQWSDIVCDYSAAGLTFQKDKIVAIAGAAEHLKGLLKDEYCAGLWRRKMEIQMCWQPTDMSERPEKRRAPSWSWFNTQRRVNYPQVQELMESYDVKFLATVTDVNLQERITEKDGVVIEGYLEMRCFLNNAVLTADGRLSIPENPAFLENHFRVVRWDFKEERREGDGFFIVGLSEVGYESWKNWASEIQGIVVRQVDGKKGIFERCGHVFWAGNTKSKEDKSFPDEYAALVSAEGKDHLPCVEFDRAKGHLIRLE